MRRASTILVLLAMLSIPMALLARGMACADAQSCNMACCSWHGSHPAQKSRPMCGQQANPEQSAQPAQCHCMCMLSHHSLPDFGLIAPMAPTHVSPLATLVTPAAHKQSMDVFSQPLAFGFFSAPFEPPRG
jgi:hypothetical protein